MLYLIDIFYSAGIPFRAFYNNHIFADIPAYERSAVRFPAHPFFIDGTNTITIAWGEIPMDKRQDKFEDFLGICPEFTVRLRAKNDWTDEGKIIFSQDLSAKNIASHNGIKIPAYSLTYENDSDTAFDELLLESAVCNTTEEIFTGYHNEMQNFSMALYKAFQGGAINYILDRAETAVHDGAKAAGITERAFHAQFKDVLHELIQDGVGYTLASPEQFVFLPTCGGRLWRAVFVRDEEKARTLTHGAAKWPHFLTRYTHELLQGKRSGGFSQTIPIILGFPDGECEIVRVA